MKVLQELIAIITKNKTRQIEIIGQTAAENATKIQELYEKIAYNEFESEEDAAIYFFNKPATSSSFRNLKNTLKNRLLNTVFFIDVSQSQFNENQKAYLNCWKNWAAAKILIGKAARLAPLEIAEKILQQSIYYEFTDLSVDILRFLRKHYSHFSQKPELFDHYNCLFKKYNEILNTEDEANEYYLKLVAKYTNKNAKKEEIHLFAKESYRQIKDYMENYCSQKLHLFGNMIRIFIYMSINDYHSTIQVCKRAIRFFESKEYVARTPMLLFYHQQLVCHTQLKQYDDGERIAKRCLDLISKEDKYNWFKTIELIFILAVHSKKFNKAYQYFQLAKNHKFLKYQPNSVKESWKIYEAYIHYLIKLKKILTVNDEMALSKFKLGKFINEVPSFSKDKRKYNIPILIIQILLLILQKRYNHAIDRIEAIDKYCYRYLRRNDTFRSNCFIKMLLLIPSSSFHKAAIERKAMKYLTQLKKTPLEVANQPHEVEIIPYEILWEMALNSLENKFYKERKTGRQQ